MFCLRFSSLWECSALRFLVFRVSRHGGYFALHSLVLKYRNWCQIIRLLTPCFDFVLNSVRVRVKLFGLVVALLTNAMTPSCTNIKIIQSSHKIWLMPCKNCECNVDILLELNLFISVMLYYIVALCTWPSFRCSCVRVCDWFNTLWRCQRLSRSALTHSTFSRIFNTKRVVSF